MGEEGVGGVTHVFWCENSGRSDLKGMGGILLFRVKVIPILEQGHTEDSVPMTNSDGWGTLLDTHMYRLQCRVSDLECVTVRTKDGGPCLGGENKRLGFEYFVWVFR